MLAIPVLELENRTGTYALVLQCGEPGNIEVGRLGVLELQPGYYVYIGSAFGPGGVRARVGHHMRRSARCHWHIDYLKPHCTLIEVWVEYSDDKREARWAGKLATHRRSSIPLNGFGASDDRAASHLFYFESRPGAAVLRTTRKSADASTSRGNPERMIVIPLPK